MCRSPGHSVKSGRRVAGTHDPSRGWSSQAHRIRYRHIDDAVSMRTVMTNDETRFRIGRKAQAYLALLPRPQVLQALSQQVLEICNQGADPEEVVLLVNKMLCHVEKPGQEAVPYRTVTRSSIGSPKDLWLFRARKAPITEGVPGCWAPPRPLAKANRLNRAGEQVLYASTNPATASREIGMLSGGGGETFSLIVYEVTRDMSLSRIGTPSLPPNIEGEMKEQWDAVVDQMDLKFGTQRYASKDNFEKVKILSEFLNRVFSGPESWYPVSQHLCRYFFPLPHGFDGWLYPSIQMGSEDQNVCLLDEHARAKLNIVEVLTLETRKNTKPRLQFARRPNGNKLVRMANSETAGRVFSDERGWGFWNEIGLDYVEAEDIQWPPK